MSTVACVLTLAVAAYEPMQVARADDSSDRERAVRARYEQAILANPSRGTAFERLYQSYVDGEGVAAWRERLDRQAIDNPNQAGPPLVLGFIRERQGEDRSALGSYAEAERREPENFRAPAARGRLLTHLRRYDEAGAALARAVKLKPPRQELQDLYKSLGRIYSRQGKLDDAKRVWRELAELFPRDATVTEELAELLVEEGELDEAIAQYQRLRELTEDDYVKVRAGHEVAELQLRQGKFEEATTLFSQLLDNLAPDSWLRAETRRRLDDAFRTKGDLDALVRFYDEWLKKHDDDIEMRLALADVHRQMGQTGEAIARYEEVLKRAVSRRDARLALATLYLDQGRYGDAAGELRQAAESAPHDAVLWEQLGAILFDDLALPEDDRREQARDAWRHIASERPADPVRAVRAAEVYRAHKLEDDALEHYEKAIKLAPENTVYHEYIGEYLHQLGRADDAIERWRGLVAGKRGTVANWLRLAEILAGFGHPDESLAAVDEGLKLAADGPEGFKLVALRSEVLLDQEQFDGAGAALDELARRADSAAQRRDVMERRVKWAQRADRLEDEIARLTRELNHAPLTTHDAPNLELLARLHQAASHWSEAIRAIERAIEHDGKSSERLRLAADLYRQAGNSGRAIEMFRRMIELDPRQETIQLEEIAELARRQGDLAAAIVVGERLIELAPDTDRGYLVTSELEWQAGHADAATETLRRGIRRSPKELALHNQLAKRLMESGKLQPALDQYWRAFEVAEEPNQKLNVARELTRAHLSTGQFDRLVERLSERRRDSQDQALATLVLAAAYREANRPERAEQELIRALAARPTDTHILDQLITLSEEQQRPERAIVYSEKLVSLRPNDAQALRKLGELFYDAGRIDDAIVRWNASLQAITKDPAGAALQLADTLIVHDLAREAQQTLVDAAARYPDDWRTSYLLAMLYKGQHQFDRARTLLDQLISRQPPGVDLIGGSPPQNPSYLGHGNRAAVVNQWLNLKMIQNLTAEDFAAGSFQLRVMYSRWYGGNRGGAGLNYSPPDFASAQFAALVQRLHVAELEGKLPEYLAELARHAGYKLELAVAAEDDKAQGRSAIANQESRRRLLKALLCVHSIDEAFEAARRFADEAPGDVNVESLLAMFATAPEEGRDLSALSGLAGDVDPFFGIERPAAIARVNIQAELLIARIAERQPEAALPIVLPHAIGLIAKSQKPEAARWLCWALDQKPPVEVQLVCLRLLLDADQPNQVIDRLPAVRVALRHAVSRSGTVSGPVSMSQWQRLSVGGQNQPEPAYAALELAKPLFDRGRRAAALDLLVDFLDATAPSSSTGLRTGQDHAVIFTLSRPQPTKFPSANSFFDAQRFEVLKEWRTRFEAAGVAAELTQRLEERRGKATGEARADAVMTLAMLDGLAGRLDAARGRLSEAADAYDDDRIRLVLAQLLVQQNKPAESLKRLQQISAPIGPIVEESLKGQLQLAERLGQTDVARQAALRLFGIRLGEANTELLQSHLRSLGLDQQAAQLRTRSAAGASGASSSPPVWRLAGLTPNANRRLELLKQFQSQQNHEAVVSLARRIIAEQARQTGGNDEEGEVAAAINALEQAGQLESEIDRLEAELTENPASTEALVQLKILYAAGGDSEKSQAITERLFAVSPDNMRLRWQHAMLLVGNEQLVEAVEHFDRILREAPWVIDDGRWLTAAYTATNQAERLVDQIVALDSVRRLSVTEQSVALSWLAGVASSLEDDYPDLALRVVRRQREIEKKPGESLSHTQAILRLLVQQGRADEVIAEFPRILPAVARPANDEAGSQRRLYQDLAGSLFNQNAESKRHHWNEAAGHSTLIAALVDLLATFGKLPVLEELIAAGANDPEWNEILGQAVQVLIDLRKSPPVTSSAERLVAEHEKLPREQPAAELAWRGAVQQCLVVELSRDPRHLALAARLAACRLPSVRPDNERYHEKVLLLGVIARAALDSGDHDRARSAYDEMAKLENPHVERGYHGGQGFWGAFQANRPHVERMRAGGFRDIAFELLLTVVDQYCNGNWDPHPCEQLLGEWASEPQSETILKDRIAKAEQQLAERPHDYTVANKLVRYYRAVGQADRVPDLLRRVVKMPGISDTQMVALADELYRIGDKSESQDIVLRLLSEGSTHWARYSWHYRTRFSAPEDAQRLVLTIAALPREPRIIEDGGDWIIRLGASLEESLDNRLPAERRQLRELAQRIYRVADSFSSVAGANPRGSGNRQHLETVALSLERLGRHDEAFELLMQAVFDSKRSGLPEPNFAALFGDSESFGFMNNRSFTRSFTRRSSYSPQRFRLDSSVSDPTGGLAAHFVWLARKTRRVDGLRQAIANRQKTDPHWNDTALRMLALIAIETGQDDEAKGLLEQILARPAPPTPDGTDVTLSYLAARVALRPDLVATACKLQAKLLESLWLNPQSMNNESLTGHTALLVRLYWQAGETEAAQAAIKRMIELGKRFQLGDLASLQTLTSSLLAEGGMWDEAVQALRPVLRQPALDIDSTLLAFGESDRDMPDTRRTHPFVRLLVKLRDADRLDDLIGRLQADWQKNSAQPPGKRNCEPIVSLAVCQVLSGSYGLAREAMQELDAKDLPASVALLADALGESPRPADGLDIVDEAFVRWPYLFQQSGEKLAILHIRTGRPLPFDDPRWLEYLDQVSKTKSGRQRNGIRLVTGGGWVASSPLGPEEQLEGTAETLAGIAETLDAAGRADESIAITELLFQKLHKHEQPHRWISLIRHTDAAKAYDICRELIGFSDSKLSPPNSAPQVLTGDELFGERSSEVDASDLTSSDRPAVQYESLSHLVVRVATDVGKLPELIADCERAMQQSELPGVRPEVFALARNASRLHLLALAEADPGRFRNLLPAFEKGEGRFERPPSESSNAATPDEPAMRDVIELCWKKPALQDQAIRLLDAMIETARKQTAAQNTGRRSGDTVSCSRLRLRLAAMQFESGQRRAAIDTCRELLDDHVRVLVGSSGARDADFVGDLERVAALLQRYDAENTMLEFIRSARKETVSLPKTDHELFAIERRLQAAAGERVPPGIVLAVQPTGPDQLRFIWQLHHHVPTSPPEDADLDDPAGSDGRRSTLVSVAFVDAAQAVAPDGYEVRIESSFDRRQFETIATYRAGGDGRSIAGATVVELVARPGELRWYRARLVSGTEVVATSRAIAAVSGENLLTVGAFSTDDPHDSARPAGWQIPTWWQGRPEVLDFDLPGTAHAAVVKCTDRIALRLEIPRSIAVDAHHGYVVCGWSLAESLPDARAKSTRRAGRGADAHAKLTFLGPHERPLGEALLNLHSQTRATFSQLVIEPADFDQAGALGEAVYSPYGSNAQRIPYTTESFLCSLAAAPRAAIGQLTVTGAKQFSFDNRNRGH